MKKKKNIYIEESVWDEIKWISQYESKKSGKSEDFNGFVCCILQNWSEKKMKELSEVSPEIFNGIRKAVYEKAKVAESLEDLIGKKDT